MRRVPNAAAALALALASACEGGPPSGGDEAERLEARPSAVTLNPGSTTTIGTEPTAPFGRYPEVTLWRGVDSCTATIVAPYVALTADHCGGTTIDWDFNGSTVQFPAARFYMHPFSRSAPPRPSWWAGVMFHDLRTVFVPSLTPEAIYGRGILLPDTDVLAARRHAEQASTSGRAQGMTLVGTASGRNDTGDFAPTRFDPAPADQGALLRDTTTPEFAIADRGDSGGPTFSSLCPGCAEEGRRALIGATKAPAAVTALTYDAGATSNALQTHAARVNSLWLAARVADPDGDGVPDECDGNRTDWNPQDTSRCPGLLGGPAMPLGDPNVSVGLLTDLWYEGRIACKPGYAAIGVRGKNGSEIRHLAVHCRAVSCIGRSCSDDSLQSADYWTERFGGETDVGGGGDFDLACPSGQIMAGVHGTHESGTVVRSLGIKCGTVADLAAGSAPFVTGLRGDPSRGTSFDATCSSNKALVGFHGRTSDREARWITGLQPVCSPHHSFFTPPVGGAGGRGEYLACPEGHVARGTVQTTRDNAVEHFAIACAIDRSDIVRFFLRGGFRNASGQRFFSEVRGGQFPYKAPSGSKSVMCPSGSNLIGVTFTADTTIRSVRFLTCQDRSTGSRTTVAVNVGATGLGQEKGFTCETGKVDGMSIRAGWLTDEVRLHCK